MAESENTGSIYGPDRETMEQVMRSVMDQLASINRDRVEGGADKLFEHLACRVKSEESMREKLEMRGLEPTAYQALRGVRDSIGIRVVTLFIDDVYETVRCLRSVPEYEIVEEKDYILKAKENGYRSYHLILSVPSDAPDADGKVPGRFFVEVQLRTIAMDTWAALEHEMKYKKSIADPELISQELRRCANELAACDVSMQTLRRIIHTL